jgi:hypothetical protein
MKRVLYKQPLSVLLDIPESEEDKPQCTFTKPKTNEFKIFSTSTKGCKLDKKIYATLIAYKKVPDHDKCEGYWIVRTYSYGNLNLCVEKTYEIKEGKKVEKKVENEHGIFNV